MTRLKRAVTLVPWKLAALAIRPIMFVHPSLFQTLYVHLLKRRGMVVNGRPSFVAANVLFDGTDYGLISLGDRCTISRDVMFLTHDYSIQRYRSRHLTDSDGVYKTVGPITIGPDAFIGARAILMPGSHVGAGCIVGTGAVVRGPLPDDVVVVGNPAEVICTVHEWAERALERAQPE